MPCYLLDTNVISEVTRPKRDPQVLAFLDQATDCMISVVTVHELEFGLQRLPPGQRRRRLTQTIAEFLALYDDRILPVESAEARAAAQLRGKAEAIGRPLHLADSLIAGTALVGSLTVATRNVADLAGLDIALHNPWQ